MWINYSRRGWKKGEPLDGKIEKERPHLIKRSFEMLIEERVQTVADIRRTLPFPVTDLEELADLEPGTLGGDVTPKAGPVLKAVQTRGAEQRSISGRRKKAVGSLAFPTLLGCLAGDIRTSLGAKRSSASRPTPPPHGLRSLVLAVVVGREVLLLLPGGDAHDLDGVADHVGGALLAFGSLRHGSHSTLRRNNLECLASRTIRGTW